MNADRGVRLAIAVGLLVVLLVAAAAALFVTESALAVWDRLRDGPAWVFALFLTLFGVLASASIYLVWRVLRPRSRTPAVEAAPEVLDRASLDARIEQARAAGVDTGSAEAELAALAARKATGYVQVALFGTISTGKSSVVRALLPGGADGDRIKVSARGGSTQEITDYQWTSPAGDRLVLTDIPGLFEAGGVLERQAREEVMRAHAVIFVCEGDMTREEFAALVELSSLDKPVILALNKSDQLDPADLATVRQRLTARATEAGIIAPQVVTVSAAHSEEVVRLLPGGGEESVTRAVAPSVGSLRTALQNIIDGDGALLETLRDSSAFWLAARKLDAAETEHRLQRSQAIVSSYTKKAVIGALAAVAPGTDILIQGYLGTGMVRELCEANGAPVSEVDLQRFLDLAQKHVGRAVPLVLAVAGNGLKAFPGVGTVAGGLMHAVAYGMIFDAMGKSLATSLAAAGQLRPGPAAQVFSEQLGEDISARARRIARLALDARRDKDSG